MQGPITVSITVADSAITAIDFVENSETANVAAVAVERIPAQIVQYQSLAVDSVTGATLASNGIKNAVAAAAETAGLDVDALRAAPVDIAPQPRPDLGYRRARHGRRRRGPLCRHHGGPVRRQGHPD